MLQIQVGDLRRAHIRNIHAENADTTFLLEDLKKKYRRDGKPLEISFRELVGWVRAGDQLTHQIHPYPAKLLPHIAHFFVNASVLRKATSYILDPFSGSGTVALEASLAGATPLVADSNPLALLISKVKTTPYDVESLVGVSDHLARKIARLRSAPSVPIVNADLWYVPETKKGLERVLRAVLEIDDPDIQDFFRVCFSVTARRLSLADPSISVPVRLRTKTAFTKQANAAIKTHLDRVAGASAAEEFAKVVHVNLARVHSANLALGDRKRAISAGSDARHLCSPDGTRLASGSIELVITSPPYGSAQKYIRAGSLSLNWLSMCPPNGLSALEGKSIGREHIPVRLQHASVPRDLPLSAAVHRALTQIRLSNPTRAAITEIYLSELFDGLKEIARITASCGHVAIVIGNNTVAGILVENDEITTTFMKELGFHLVLSLRDRIHSRGLLTERHATAGMIGRESILLFGKSA